MARVERERVVEREELAAAIGARRELDGDLEPYVLDAFLERIERRIDARVADAVTRSRRSSTIARAASLPLAIVSLIFAIPLTAIAGDTAGFEGLLVVWIGIVLVNVVFARR